MGWKAGRGRGLVRLVLCAPTPLGSSALAAVKQLLRGLPADVSAAASGVVRCGADSVGAWAGDDEEVSGRGSGSELSTDGELWAAHDAAASLLSVAAMIRRARNVTASSDGAAAFCRAHLAGLAGMSAESSEYASVEMP